MEGDLQAHRWLYHSTLGSRVIKKKKIQVVECKNQSDRRRVGWLNGSSFIISTGASGRGAARAEDAQGTPTQSHISSSILVYEDKQETPRLSPLMQEPDLQPGA